MEIAGADRPNSLRPIACLGALALGLCVPVLVLGRAGMAVTVIVAVVCLLAVVDRRLMAADVAAALRSPLGMAVAITFALWLVSAVGSIDIAPSVGVWFRMATLLLAGVAFVSWLRHRQDLHVLALKTLIVAAVTGGAITLFSVLIWPEPYLLLRGDHASVDPSVYAASHLKSYGAAIACSMPVVLWAGWRLAPTWRIPAVIFQPIAVAAMIAVQSRASLIAVALGAGAFALWFVARRGRYWLATLIAGTMIAVVVGTFLTNVRGNQIEPLTGIPTWLVDAHRQAIWDKGLDLAAEAPLFGWGFGVISTLPGADEYVPGSNVEFIPSHPHNWMIEVFVETGVIGFVAMVATLVVMLRGMLRSARRGGAAGATMLALFAVFFAISSISFSFWAFWWQATFVLLACLVVAPLTPGLLSSRIVQKVTQP